MNATVKKFSAGAIGGAVAVIAVWAIKQFGGIELPTEVAAAGGSLLVVVASILIPDSVEEA